MISVGRFRQTSNRRPVAAGGDFSFALNVPTEIHSSTTKSGTVRSGLTASDQLNIPDQHRGEVMGKLAASNLMEEKLFPSQ
jgi:hypothetical protein